MPPGLRLLSYSTMKKIVLSPGGDKELRESAHQANSKVRSPLSNDVERPFFAPEYGQKDCGLPNKIRHARLEKPMKTSANQRRSQKKRYLPFSERATLSPEEFAAQFGKQKVWTYRQIYAGRVKAITGFGNMMIPRAELDRVLNSAEKFS